MSDLRDIPVAARHSVNLMTEINFRVQSGSRLRDIGLILYVERWIDSVTFQLL